MQIKSPKNIKDNNGEEGVALVLVLFIVALSTILVTQLTFTTALDTRLHLVSRRSLEAEYLLKSAINLARAIIKEDTSPEDAEQDTWAMFRDGMEIPREILQIDDPNVRVEVEIRPEESKIPIRALIGGQNVQPKWRDALYRLFQKLGFDDDNEKDTTGYFGDKVFNSAEMVANLIDYMDIDNESYRPDDFPASGIESELPEGAFANQAPRWLGELYAIPGFTTRRIRLMTPFITTFGAGRRININLAPRVVLESLHPEIGPNEVAAIIAFRSEKPFDHQNRKTELVPIIGENIYNEISPMIDVQSKWFQVLSKVDFGSSSMFMRAYVSQGEPGELPIMRLSEIFQ